MKKYACLLFFALLLNGCDDGDLTVDSVNFDSVTPQSCDTINRLIYKLKSQESLLLQLPPNSIKNDVTVPGTPIIYNIDSNGNGSYRFLYRAYDGTVATANICGTIPPKTPNVTQEWVAISGQIVIISTQDFETDATTGATKITGYTHNINLKNVTFSKPSGIDQVQEDFPFGNFTTKLLNPVAISFTDSNAGYCEIAKKIYNDNGTSAVIIKNFDDTLIKNEETPPGQPRTRVINATATTNNVTYETYAGTLPDKTSDYFCAGQTSSPPVNSTWVANTGSSTNQTGIIEVTTTLETNVFRHKVVLRSTTFQKGNSTFTPGTTFLIGTFTTSK